MSEKDIFSSVNQAPKEEDAIDLEDFGNEAKLFGVKMPQPGTPAYDRLVEACRSYADWVDYGETSPLPRVNEKARENSDSRRREAHNRLCVMIMGKTWNELSFDERAKISDFAVLVANKPQYKGTFR